MDPHLQCLTATNARGETSQEEADEYDGQHDRAITDMLKALLESPATLETFEVNASTAQRAPGAHRPIVPVRPIHRAGVPKVGIPG
jgi:hypothetical protein